MSKIFTVFFAFGGVGIALFALSMMATAYFERREKALLGGKLQRKLKESAEKSEKDRMRRKGEILKGSKFQ